MLPEGYEIRPLDIDDGRRLGAAYRRNREHLARWDPVREESFYTDADQAQQVKDRLDANEGGRGASWVLEHDGEIVGRVNLDNLVRGVLQSASVGYWVDSDQVGRGLATAMVEHAVAEAVALGLHRLEAGTMVENVASQGVLLRAGFVQYGAADKYLFMAGSWQDHLLFQRILHPRPPGNPVP